MSYYNKKLVLRNNLQLKNWELGIKKIPKSKIKKKHVKLGEVWLRHL